MSTLTSPSRGIHREAREKAVPSPGEEPDLGTREQDPLQLPRDLARRYGDPKLLGRGGMGVVLRVTDRSLDREVALKLLSVEPSPELLSRMEREARVLARIRHPGVIEVYDHGVSEGRPFLVMEYLRGRDLSSLPPGVAPLEIMLTVSEALEAAHQEGVLHRDLKPENIFRTEDGRVVLMDFGLSLDRGGEGLTSTGAVVGTLVYMAPEVLDGEPPEASADWWGWGATLYRLLQGRAPFTVPQLLLLSSGEEVPLEFPLPVPREVERLLRRCLQSDPGARPRGRRALEAVLGACGRPARPPPEAGRPADRADREKSLPSSRFPALLVFALFSLGLLSFFFPWGPRREVPGADGKVAGGGAGERYPSGSASPQTASERARRELADLGWMYVGPDGQVEDFQGREPPEGWRELLSPDPSHWGEILSHAEELEEIRRELLVLDPSELRENLRAQRGSLEEVDEAYRGLGLPRPFHAWLNLQARRAPLSLPAGLFSGDPDRSHLPPRVEGWLASALEAFLRAREVQAGMERVVESWLAGEENLPEAFPVELLFSREVASLGAVPRFQDSLWRRSSARRVSGSWSRPLGEETHRFLLHAAMGLRQLPPEESARWGLRMALLVRELRWWNYTYLARCQPAWVLGEGPRSSGEDWLSFYFHIEQARLSGDLGWSRERFLVAAREAHARLQKHCLPQQRLQLLESILDLEYYHGYSEKLLMQYRTARPGLRLGDASEQLAWILTTVLWAGRLQAGTPRALTREEIEELLAVLARYPRLLSLTRQDLDIGFHVRWAQRALSEEGP